MDQFVVFRLGTEDYGVGIAEVESIIKLQEVTKLPRAPEFIDGIINLRGAIIPVINMRKRFGFDLQEVTNDTRIVVANMGGIKVGLIVDAVKQVINIPQDAIEPPPPLALTIDSAFIRAIARYEQQLVILIDLNQVLSTEERATLAAM